MHSFLHSRRLSRKILSRVTWSSLALGLLLCLASPAAAHLTSLNASIIPIAGASVTIKTPGSLQFSPNRGGRVQLKLRNVIDPMTNKGVNSIGNTADMDVVINGVPQTLMLTFTLKSGNAQIMFPGLNLVAPDLVEVQGLIVKDSNGIPFGTMGLKVPGLHFSSAIIQVHGTPSPLTLAPTRDADTTITANSGVFSLRLDQITPRNTTNNHVEVEYSVNGGAPVAFQKNFDIVNGIGLVAAPLGLVSGDLVEVFRIDVYDSNNDRFATLGVRIMSPLP